MDEGWREEGMMDDGEGKMVTGVLEGGGKETGNHRMVKTES